MTTTTAPLGFSKMGRRPPWPVARRVGIGNGTYTEPRLETVRVEPGGSYCHWVYLLKHSCPEPVLKGNRQQTGGLIFGILQTTATTTPFEEDVRWWQLTSQAYAVVEGGRAVITQAGEHTSTPPLEGVSAGDASATGDAFDLVLSCVAQLPQEDGEDDPEGGPTEHAIGTAVRLLAEARPLVAGPFPRASTATTEERGIHVYWRKPNRTLQLSVPAGEQGTGFVYHREGQHYASERNVSAPLLAEWIRWFNNA